MVAQLLQTLVPVAVLTPVFAPVVTKALGLPVGEDIKALLPVDRDMPFFKRLPKQ
jgi:hypothetical protein